MNTFITSSTSSIEKQIRGLPEESGIYTYGYDEFGQNLYRNQGQIQPFGYTGYQSDRIADTYYAQAREYRAELGRFAGVDIIKGFAAAPYTLNEYGYCWNRPLRFKDIDGREPYVVEYDFNVGETPGEPFRVWRDDEVVLGAGVARLLDAGIRLKPIITTEDYMNNIESRTELIEFIKYAEGGFHATPYDSDGDDKVDTIAFGHDIIENNDSYSSITLAEAEKLLIEDMREQAPVELMETLDDNEIYLKPNERDALVSLFFQLGRNTSSSDESPNFRKLLLSGNFDNEEIIISEFLTYGGNDSNYSGNRKRRMAEAEMFLFGTYDLEFYERCVGD